MGIETVESSTGRELASGVGAFLEHFGARGMRWGRLDPSSRAEEGGGVNAPFIQPASGAGSPTGPGGTPPIDQRAEGAAEQAQLANQQSAQADQEAQQAMQTLQSLQAEQTQVATQAHVAAQAQAAAAAAPAATPASKASATTAAAAAAVEKAHLAQITAANKAAAKAQAAQKVLENKLAKAEARLKTIAAKAKAAKIKAAAKKAHAAKLKAIAKKAKALHQKHKAHKALTAKQKAAKKAYDKLHPHSGTHKPLTAAQKAKTNAAAKAKYAKEHPKKVVVKHPAPVHRPVVSHPAATKKVKAPVSHLPSNFAAPPTSVAKAVGTSKANATKATTIANTHRLTHGIDNVGALVPHDKPVGKGGPEFVAKTVPAAFTKDPSAAQRKLLAKMGLAMPDGSFYIRNGPVGASDLQNAIDSVGRGESDGSSGDPIRLHIMKRAKALGLTSKIPDTWNANGSLKHSETIGNTDKVEHFGVKGMHWGVKTSQKKGDLEARAAKHEQLSVNNARVASHYKTQHEDLLNNGVKSAAFKQVYGDHAHAQTDSEFFVKNGQTKAGALQKTDNNLRLLTNIHVHAANRHSKKAVKLRAAAAKMQHGEIVEIVEEADEILIHFGVKGMHWGVDKQRTGPASEDHTRVAELKTKIGASGGIHALSNTELKAVTERLNLEQQYSRLQPEHVAAGKKALRGGLKFGGEVGVNIAKQQATTFGNKYAAKTIENFIKKAASAKAA